jgi:hypothetical protein
VTGSDAGPTVMQLVISENDTCKDEILHVPKYRRSSDVEVTHAFLIIAQLGSGTHTDI